MSSKTSRKPSGHKRDVTWNFICTPRAHAAQFQDQPAKSDFANDTQGSGGGPLEDNTTSLLVRAVASKWEKNCMVAVDAGVHLAAINRIMEETLPDNIRSVPLPHTIERGPFAGLEVNSRFASQNAANIARSLVDTYLFTHPHLDHIAGFVINTAGLPGPGPRPKRLAGLPATIDAFKKHIFNDVIWPNLTDESGAGLITYLGLVDGGSPALGVGEGRGYLEVAENLCIKACSISHGEPVASAAQRGSHSSASTPARYSSFDASSMTPSQSQQHLHHYLPPSAHISSPRSVHHYPQPHMNAGHRTPSFPSGFQSQSAQQSPSLPASQPAQPQVNDSTAYFIRDSVTGSEVLIFGDVEPDSLSPFPRNIGIWQEAAPKIVRGDLRAIFLECSYDDSHPNDRMFGHLKPSFIAEELRNLASEVRYLTTEPGAAGTEQHDEEHGLRSVSHDKKRKRNNSGVPGLHGLARRRTGGSSGTEPVSPKTIKSRINSATDDNHGRDYEDLSDNVGPLHTPHISTPTAELSLRDIEARTLDTEQTPGGAVPTVDGGIDASQRLPLQGIKVVLYHVKDKLDGGDQCARVLEELQGHEAEDKTGAEFVVSRPGLSIYV